MIVLLTTSDTDIMTLDRAKAALPHGLADTGAVNPFALMQEDGAFDEFARDALPNASIVLARLLGGDKAMGKHFRTLESECKRLGVPLVACSGEPVRDAVFERRSTTPPIVAQTAFEYLNHGGVANLANLLRFLSDEALGSEYGLRTADAAASGRRISRGQIGRRAARRVPASVLRRGQAYRCAAVLPRTLGQPKPRFRGRDG